MRKTYGNWFEPSAYLPNDPKRCIHDAPHNPENVAYVIGARFISPFFISLFLFEDLRDLMQVVARFVQVVVRG
jgi:hypothetical protein